ncbi:MAG: cytochrome c oxidase subunit 4 [Candidatus Eremiobacteraeota bacterium]|nr:cytochrome c oxidase subunit 4 [Candidatus Eremiobacteraeota bacterium]
MRTFVGLFLSSAAFGIITAVIYWFCSYDLTGTVLLGLMATALVFAAGYALLAEREAHLDGDSPDISIEDVAGEDLGIFMSKTAWPILMAFSALMLLIGAVWSPFLLFAALTAMLLILWRLGAESSRIA